jgi:hypothetical protein
MQYIRRQTRQFVFQLVCIVAGVLIFGYLRTCTVTSTMVTSVLVAAASYTVGVVLWSYVFAPDVPPLPPPRHVPHDESP